MPNKRFLGLGFTFTATDKGLEKKLSSVSSLLTDISDELDTVNKKFKSFGSAVPNRKKAQSQSARPAARPQAQSRKRGGATRPSPMMQSFQPQTENKFSFDYDLGMEKLGKESQKFVDNLAGKLGKQGFAFKESLIKESGLFTDQFGELTQESEKKLIGVALQYSKTTAAVLGDFKKLGKALQLIGATTLEYLSDVKDSFGNFLGSLGLHLNEIIPPQFMAFGKLLKTVIGGPLVGLFKGAKNLIKKPFAKKTEEQQGALEKDLKGTKIFASVDKKLGKNTKSESLYAKTAELVDIEKEKKVEEKQGVLGKIGSMLKKLLMSPFTLIAGAASLLWKGLSALFSPLKTLRAIFSGVSSFLEGPFGKALKGFGRGFGELLAEVAVFGSAIYGFVKGIIATKEEWGEFFTGIGDIAKSVWGLMKSLFSSATGGIFDSLLAANPVLDSFVTALKGVAEFLLNLPMLLLKTIASGFENIAGFLGIGAGMAGKAMSAFSKTIDSVTATVAKPADTTAKPDNRVQGLRDGMAVQQQTDSLKSSEQQVSLMQENNGLLNQLLGTMAKAPPGGQSVSVVIGSDARKQGIALEKQELDMHGLSAQ